MGTYVEMKVRRICAPLNPAPGVEWIPGKNSQTQQVSEDPAQPDSYTRFKSVREILQAEPVGERMDSAQDHYLEFVSYLRPVLKGNIVSE